MSDLHGLSDMGARFVAEYLAYCIDGVDGMATAADLERAVRDARGLGYVRGGDFTERRLEVAPPPTGGSTHGGEHAALPNGVILDRGYCKGCDAARSSSDMDADATCTECEGTGDIAEGWTADWTQRLGPCPRCAKDGAL